MHRKHWGSPLSGGLPQAGSEVDLLRDFQRAAYLDTEIPDGVLPLPWTHDLEAASPPAAKLACRAGEDRDRWARFISGGLGPAGSASPTFPRPTAREQSSGKLPPPHPAARAATAAIQISSFGPALSHHPRRDLQHLLQPTTSHQPPLPSPLFATGLRQLGSKPPPEI